VAAPSVDHAEQLFQAMRGLPGIEGASAAARFCMEEALRAVPCLAGLVHLRDPAMGDLVVVHAQGPRAEALVRTRTTREDPLVARAAAAGKPTVVTYGTEPGTERATCRRHAFFDPWSVAVVPVLHGGQVLALLEMIDPIDGRPFDEHAQGALAYVAARLAKFLAEHGA
jgi:GAF domain-containing protein